MEPTLQTSFIPRQQVSQQKSPIAQKSIGLILIGAIIIFLGTAGLAGGVFLYKQFLQSQITAKSQSLARAQAAFEPGTIQTLKRLSTRIEAAKTVLAGHQAPSIIFNELSALTLKTVRYRSFEYGLNDKGQPKITLRGQAKDYASVALQSDVFGKSKIIKSPIFSDLNPDTNGIISFVLTATVDPAVLIYQAGTAPIQQ